MNFDANVPIYLQIIEDFKKKIIKGEYVKGDKIRSVRDLAVDYGVNPNTVQRSLSELEREGLVYSERTSGRYITKEDALISNLQSAYALHLIDVCVQGLQDLNMNNEQILDMMKGRLQNG